MPPELDQEAPEMDQDMPDMGADPSLEGPAEGNGDQEGAMAKQELIKLANYATNLQEHIDDDEQLEAWVQSKITIAATNIASVYHYLAYEKKIGEYGEAVDHAPISESQKRVLKFRLNEAKEKLKALKKADAAKMAENAFDWKNKKSDDNGDYEKRSSTGGTTTKKGSTITHKHNPDRFTDEPHSDNDRTKSHAKARSSADKAGDRAMDKAAEKESKAWGKSNPGKQTIHKDGKTTTNEAKMAPGNMAHHHACEYAKHHKSGNLELAMHHKEACESCGGTITHGAMGECYHQHPHLNGGGIYECPGVVMEAKSKTSKKGDGNLANNAKPYDKITRGDVIAGRLGKDEKGGKAVKEAAPRGQRSQDSAIKVAQIGKSKSPGANLKQGAEDALEKGNHKKIDQIHQYATTTTPTGRAKKVSEAKPSAGLSAAKKSAVVKDAKAGKDIGKPGKSFDKLAKKAGGGEKGEKIAAAAMWKNIKETTAYIAEKAKVKPDYIDLDKDGDKTEPMKKAAKEKETVKESADLARMRQLMTRLNG